MRDLLQKVAVKSMLLLIGHSPSSFQLEWLDLDCSGDVAAFYFSLTSF